MNNIIFQGMIGTVIATSPHGNYLVVQLSDRVTICGTFSNKWGWELNPDITSGFKSFITYIGINNDDDYQLVREFILDNGGSFKPDEDCYRPAKRNPYYPYEIKVRNLSPEIVKAMVLEEP